VIYKIEFKKAAIKFLESQSKQQQARILKAIYKLPSNGDIKKVVGSTMNLYRLRVGNIRIVYEIKDDELVIIVINIGNRGDIYKKI